MPPNNTIDVFHPVHRREEGAWFPGNEDTSLLVHIGHVWEDIERLIELRKECTNEYDKRLLLKYVFVEARSLFQAMDRLQGLVMRSETYPDGHPRPYRGLSSSERQKAKELWSRYTKAKSRVEQDIIRVRNHIGAHRSTSDWQLVMQLWDQLDPKMLREFLATVPAAYNYSKDLNIFEWNRTHEDGSIEVLAGPIDPSQFLFTK